jgi:hypothetical protein
MRSPGEADASGAPRPTQQRAQPLCDLGQRERLGDIVVPAGAEPRDAIRHRVARGQEQDGRAYSLSAQCLAEVAPVGVG